MSKEKKRYLALFLADAHLQEGAWPSRLPELAGDALCSFRQAVTIAIKHQVPIISAGDLFDTRQPSSYVVDRYIDEIRRLQHALQKKEVFFFISGQHELANPPWASLAEGTCDINNRFRGFGSEDSGVVNIFGMNWCPSEVLPERLARAKEQSLLVRNELPKEIAQRDRLVLVCHQVWKELTNFSPEGALADIEGFGLVVTGDRHHGKEFTVNGPDGVTRVLSPGALAPQNITEPAEPRAWLLADDMSLKAVPLQHRVIYDISAFETSADLAEFLQDSLPELLDPEQYRDLPNELQLPILAASVQPGAPVAPELVQQLRGMCAGKAHLFLTATDLRTTVVADEDHEQTEAASWLEDGLDEFVAARPELADLRDDAFALLRATEDPAGRIEAMYQQAIAAPPPKTKKKRKKDA